jgi:hypothetical protein
MDKPINQRGDTMSLIYYDDLSPESRYNIVLIMEFSDKNSKAKSLKWKPIPNSLTPVDAHFSLLFAIDASTKNSYSFEQRPAELPVFKTDLIISYLAVIDTIFQEEVTSELHLYLLGIDKFSELANYTSIKINRWEIRKKLLKLSGIGLLYYFDIPYNFNDVGPRKPIFRLNGWGRHYFRSWLCNIEKIQQKTQKLKKYLLPKIRKNRNQYIEIIEIMKNHESGKMIDIRKQYKNNTIPLPIVI